MSTATGRARRAIGFMSGLSAVCAVLCVLTTVSGAIAQEDAAAGQSDRELIATCLEGCAARALSLDKLQITCLTDERLSPEAARYEDPTAWQRFWPGEEVARQLIDEAAAAPTVGPERRSLTAHRFVVCNPLFLSESLVLLPPGPWDALRDALRGGDHWQAAMQNLNLDRGKAQRSLFAWDGTEGVFRRPPSAASVVTSPVNLFPDPPDKPMTLPHVFAPQAFTPLLVLRTCDPYFDAGLAKMVRSDEAFAKGAFTRAEVLDRHADVNGVECVECLLTTKLFVRHWWVAPEMGCITLRNELLRLRLDGGLYGYNVSTVADLRKVREGLWIPGEVINESYRCRPGESIFQAPRLKKLTVLAYEQVESARIPVEYLVPLGVPIFDPTQAPPLAADGGLGEALKDVSALDVWATCEAFFTEPAPEPELAPGEMPDLQVKYYSGP